MTELSFGSELWSINLPPEKRIQPVRQSANRSRATLYEQVRDALERPSGFESLRRALTPDDRVVIVIEETLPNIAEGIRAILEHLQSAHIEARSVTVITPPGQQNPSWLEDIPDEFADLQTEIHDPNDRQKLAYLATTRNGRRIYLNRTLIEADFAIVLSSRRYDLMQGYGGVENCLYPALSDQETREKASQQLQYSRPEINQEAVEVAWLFGSPFFIQVFEDGDEPIEVLAGLPSTIEEGISLLDRRASFSIPEFPDTVITTLGPNAGFRDLVAAVVHISRILPRDGKMILLAPPIHFESDGLTVLRRSDSPRDAAQSLKRFKNDDAAFCLAWAKATSRNRVYLTNLSDDDAEELFATRIGNAAELQRLLEHSERVLVVPNSHRIILNRTRDQATS